MKALSIIAAVLCLMFFMVITIEPSLADSKKNSNGENQSDTGKTKAKIKIDQNQDQKQSKDQDRDQDQDRVGQTDELHIIDHVYSNLKGTLPMFADLAFTVETTTVHIEWLGKPNDENTSADGRNYNAQIGEGKGYVIFTGVKLNGNPTGNIKVLINSIKSAQLNEHFIASGDNKKYDEIFLRAESINITILGITKELEHPMIKIQNGELQFLKFELDDEAIQQAPPQNTTNKVNPRYITLGKIKSIK